MDPILTEFPYPWSRRTARELHDVLCEIYPTAKGAMFVAVRAGIQESRINADAPAIHVWQAVLEEGARIQSNGAIVTIVRDLNPRVPRRPFLEALLAGSPPMIEGQPKQADGAPLFLKDTDQITEPEALLFKDDLTMAIGRLPWLIDVLGRLRALAPSVCRLEVGNAAGSQSGTGFRIGPDLLLTNWHVLHPEGAKGTAVVADFGYEDDGQGGLLNATSIDCDPATITADPGDDWGVVRVTNPMAAGIATIALSKAVDPVEKEEAFIVQHPGGGRKRLAYVRNQITSFTDRVVHYLSDTQGGSSGSPVLNADGKLIALHHAGGRPQEVAGKLPLKKNEGIRIERVRAGLQQAGIAFD